MSTTVNVNVPTPNHLRARVTFQHKNAEGVWVDSPSPPSVVEQGGSLQAIVYGSQRLLIEETE